jgi:hypothetical protein
MTSELNIHIDEIISKFLHQEVIYEPQLISFEKKTLRILKNNADIKYFKDRMRVLKSKIDKSGSFKLEIKKEPKDNKSKKEVSKYENKKNSEKSVSKAKYKRTKPILNNASSNRQKLSVSPKSIVNNSINEWFSSFNLKLNIENLRTILGKYEIKIEPDEVITMRKFKSNEINLNRIYNELLSERVGNEQNYERPNLNPWVKSKFNNPTKGKEGNYNKLIYIRTKT